VKEFDIFIPLRYNDGSRVEPSKFQQLQAELLDEFGGLTYFPQANQGFWKLGSVTFRDEIVVYRVLTADSRTDKRFLLGLKERLKQDLVQEEILIVERDVKAL
jgi:hypothetical protein